MRVWIDRPVAAAMRQHARAALPAEACGLLAGPPRTAAATLRFVRYVPMVNGASQPDRFRMDPIAVARAERQMREAGLALAGVFHSHPQDPAVPSAADEAAAWPDLVQVIQGQDGTLAAFTPRGDRLVPVKLDTRSR